MSEKRFVQLGDTSIKDTLTGEEWYAPCEDSLLDLLNELYEENEALKKFIKDNFNDMMDSKLVIDDE